MHTLDVNIVNGPKIDALFEALKTSGFRRVGFHLKIKRSQIFIYVKITGIKVSDIEKENWIIDFTQIGKAEATKYSSKNYLTFFRNGKEITSSYSTKTKTGYFSM